ncbi:MAG: hypothetical protein HDR23_10215 [Lachnospiraceae bacterium]|nr:hypothetical protein [Lachnospiraceae bacterium]
MIFFIMRLTISLIFSILTIVFLVIALIKRKNRATRNRNKNNDNEKYIIIASLCSALVVLISLFNITVPMPVILPLSSNTKKYADNLEVTIKSNKYDLLETYYTLDSTDPEDTGKIYKGAITVSEPVTIYARNKFLWKWSDIAQSSYDFIEESPIEEQPEKELSRTIIVNFSGRDVEIDRITKIPVDSYYPDIPMEAKMTSVFNSDYDYMSNEYVSGPFISPIDNLDGLYREIQEEILRNPVYGDMVARGLANDSNWFSDNDVWLNEFIEKSDEYYEMESNPETAVRLERWLMADINEPEKYYVNVDYRIYAENICQLLDEFMNLGVHSYTSDGYWALNLGFGSYTRTYYKEDVESNPEALILCKKATNGTVISVLGFDLRDKALLHYKHSVVN